MGRATAEERERRRLDAFKLLVNGWTFSQTVTHLCTAYGVSRATGRLITKAAIADLVDDMENVERKDLAAQGLERLQAIARKAEEAGQYGAAIGAWRSVVDLAGLGAKKP
jgi:hypothetical protein